MGDMLSMQDVRWASTSDLTIHAGLPIQVLPQPVYFLRDPSYHWGVHVQVVWCGWNSHGCVEGVVATYRGRRFGGVELT